MPANRSYRLLVGGEVIEFDLEQNDAEMIHLLARSEGMGDCEFIAKIAVDRAQEILGQSDDEIL